MPDLPEPRLLSFIRPVGLWLAALALAVVSTQTAWAAQQGFGFQDVDRLAREAAREADHPHDVPALPHELQALDYDHYRDIRFKPDHALWRKEGLPFELMFFHRGFNQTNAVRIHEIVDGQVRALHFDAADFDYGRNPMSPAQWGDIGYAGFRVHYALNTPTYKDEFVVFLGASYFRLIGQGQRYGLSARGLAIDTVGGHGEEFPRFSTFWIEKPHPQATSLVIYALMASTRTTGAYRFEVHPGSETVVQVQSRIYLRAGTQTPIATLGIAPLTSMFLFGENQPDRQNFRPEVHDSDGLLLHAGTGEWLWRPLLNPSRTLTTSFAMPSLRGFGLMQRDHQFSSYEDVETRYDLRPSAWVELTSDWGPGRVELMAWPAPNEACDNIVAYWVPAHLPTPDHPLTLSYRVHWQGLHMQRPPSAWTVQSRSGRGATPLAPDEHQYVIDFAGPAIDKLPADAPMQAIASCDDNGRIVEHTVYRNEATGTWRVTLRVQQRQASRPVELRVFLQHQQDTVSETWSNVIPSRP